MKLFDTKISNKTIAIYSLILAFFVIYPNLGTQIWYLHFGKETDSIFFFLFRYAFFVLLFFVLLRWNIKKNQSLNFAKRFAGSFLMAAVAYGVYVVITLVILGIHGDHFTITLVFQYIVSLTVSAGIGHVYHMYQQQKAKELEIEQLKVENLQSRYEALTNQINPHFFFNALNSLTGLVRNEDKKSTLLFITKLSEVFRYILKSDKKGLVTLNEELVFMESYQYLLEIRYANKLSFKKVIPDNKLELRLPVLSLLPLIENVIQHNTIDSDNVMVVSIELNANDELVVSNPIYPKIEETISHKTGLSNLNTRFALLIKKNIRVTNEDDRFSVYLPLITG